MRRILEEAGKRNLHGLCTPTEAAQWKETQKQSRCPLQPSMWFRCFSHVQLLSLLSLQVHGNVVTLLTVLFVVAPQAPQRCLCCTARIIPSPIHGLASFSDDQLMSASSVSVLSSCWKSLCSWLAVGGGGCLWKTNHVLFGDNDACCSRLGNDRTFALRTSLWMFWM